MNNIRYMRLPFPGNQIPKERMDPIALRVIQDIPLPNQPGDPVTKLNNWFGGNVSETNRLPQPDRARGPFHQLIVEDVWPLEPQPARRRTNRLLGMGYAGYTKDPRRDEETMEPSSMLLER